MLCPVDATPLVMSDRAGVEIDYCPKCRGVWLDRGELDKIIDRAAIQAPAAPVPPAPPAYGHAPQPVHSQPRPGHDRDEGYRRDDGYYRKKRKESFLGDLFDF